MKKINQQQFDVIIIGGSYSGLAAAMALGRALKQVLIIDSGLPCNRQTPFSHNFLTQDGNTPATISALGKAQVLAYPNVTFQEGLAVKGSRNASGYEIELATGLSFSSKKVIFATGISDLMPTIEGFANCWGISVLHCPYCHGYEVKYEKTGIFSNGEAAYEFASLISNWTKDLTVFTNGPSGLSVEQAAKLAKNGIGINEKEISALLHEDGHLQQVRFKDGTLIPLKAMYARIPFTQHCPIPEQLGCELTEEGYISTDNLQETTVSGVFACGDNTTRMRSLSNAVAMGSMAGVAASRQLIFEEL